MLQHFNFGNYNNQLKLYTPDVKNPLAPLPEYINLDTIEIIKLSLPCGCYKTWSRPEFFNNEKDYQNEINVISEELILKMMI